MANWLISSLKQPLMTKKKVKRIRSYVLMLSIEVIFVLMLSSYVSISIFLDITKLADFR